MRCSLCGFIFNEKEAESGCKGCGLVKSCELVKCPNCGFEMTPEPKWAKKIKEWRN
jgi:rubredoxin